MMTDQEFLETIDRAITGFKGSIDELESAIGTLATMRKFGWKPLYLIHQRSTMKKYEKILGVNFRDCVPAEGPLARKSVAWTAAQTIGNFWKAVKGEIKGIKTPIINER